MATGRQRSDWNHTAAVLCIIANVNRSPKKSAYKPDDFNPYATTRKTDTVIPACPENWQILEQVVKQGKI